MDYQGLVDDRLPPIPKPLLQQYDNYQIYSMVWFAYTYDLDFQVDRKRSRNIFVLADTRGNPNVLRDGVERLYYGTQETMEFAASSSFQYAETVRSLSVMYQKYSLEKIPFNFIDIANKIKVYPRNKYRWIQLDNVTVIDTVADQYTYSGLQELDDQAVVDRSEYQIRVNNANDPNHPTYNGKFNYLIRREEFYETFFPNFTSTKRAVLTYTIYSDTYSRYGEFTEDLNVETLINGYDKENKIKAPNLPIVTPNKTGRISIGYYRINPYERMTRVEGSRLSSLDWMTYQVDVFKDIPVVLPLEDPVLGTLYFSGDINLIADIKSKLGELTPSPNSSTRYPWSDYYYENVDNLINRWITIYNAIPLPSKPDIDTTFLVGYEWRENYTSTLKVLSANNDAWNNDSSSTSDINLLSTDVSLSLSRAHNLHVEPIVQNYTIVDYGRLVMDSPRTIEIHKALNAGKYAINDIDNTKQRVTDLGFLVERIAKVLGIRFDANGQIEVAKEKKIVRQVVNIKDKIDEKKIGVNCFGDEGIVVRRINNRFKNKDEIVSDQCVILQDIPDMIQEYFEQSNLALGIQESSAIEIKDPNDKDGKNKARFDNQLGLLLEIFNLLSSANEMTRANLISSLITQSQTSEVIAGLGLPSVTKTIPIKIDKKVTQLPYKGIAAHRSISQEVATCTANVGIVLGQLL